MNETDHEATVQDAYIAYYGRPADPVGLDYWAGRLAGEGGNLSAILAAFGSSDEFTERFGGLGSKALIHAIYQRVFHRDADAEGLRFYVERLESGAASLAEIAMQVLDGAKGEDLRVLGHARQLAGLFTELIEDAGLDYSGERGTEVGINAVEVLGSAFYRHWYAETERLIREGQANGSRITRENGRLKMEHWAPMIVSQLPLPGEPITVDRFQDIGVYTEHKVRFLWGDRDALTWHGRFVEPLPHLNGTERDQDSIFILNLPPGTYEIDLQFLGLLPRGAETDHWAMLGSGSAPHTAGTTGGVGYEDPAEHSFSDDSRSAYPELWDADARAYRFTMDHLTDLVIVFDGVHGGGERDYTFELRAVERDPDAPVIDWQWDPHSTGTLPSYAASFYEDYLL